MKRAREAEQRAEDRRQVRAWRAAALFCKGDHDDAERPKYDGRSNDRNTWLWCEGCDAYCLCEECVEMFRDRLDIHETICTMTFE